jgi:hypothetical protein
VPYQPIIAAPIALVMWSYPGAMSVGERPQRVERRLAAEPQLLVHVVLDHVHRHVARAFDHHLHVVLPRDLRQFAERGELRHLRFVVRIGARAGPQAVAERERDVVRLHDLADLGKRV